MSRNRHLEMSNYREIEQSIFRTFYRPFERLFERLSARSVCKIKAFSIDFPMPVKYRGMKGKRVNIIDNEVFGNLP